MVYDPKAVSEHYNKYGYKEWERLNGSPYDRINYYLHMHFLSKHIGEGAKVLDAGCGAGRFSVEMARLGCLVTLLDISSEQLSIAKNKLAENYLLGNIDQVIEGDLCNLSAIPDDTFDVVVCFGAPLNYLLENCEQAIQELIRVTKKGGCLLVSVNSKWGVIRAQLGKNDFDYTSFFGKPDYWFINEVLETGDLPKHELVSHPPRHFFDALELEELLKKNGLTDITLGGSPCITSGFRQATKELNDDEVAWKTILEIEEKAYCLRTLVDNGEFILAKGFKA